MTQKREARRAGGAAGLWECSLPESENSLENANPSPAAQEIVSAHSREIARTMRREEVFDAASEAMNYLGAVMNFVAADDVRGLRYSYAKFAACGRVGVRG